MVRTGTLHIKSYKYLICIALTLCCNGWLHAQTKVWSLSSCISRALQENISLNQQLSNNELNRINYDQARANRWPSLNFSDAYSLNYGRSVNPVTNQYANQDTKANNVALTGSVTLFNGLKNINLIRENKLNYEAGNLDVEKMKNTLMLNVVAAYMQVLFEYEAINIAQAQIDRTTENLSYTERYVKAGALPESNILQMKAQLATDAAARVSAESQLQLAKVILMQLMELPVTADFEIERPELKELFPDMNVSAAAVYTTASGFLPETKSASIRTRAAEAGLRVSKAGLLPKLTLGGNLSTLYSSNNMRLSYQTLTATEHIGYLAGNPASVVDGPVSTTITNTSAYPFFSQLGDNFGQSISLNLSVPITNNRIYKSEIERNEVAVRVARLNEKLVNNDLRKSIETAVTEQSSAGKNYAAAQAQLTAAEQSYRNIVVKFKAGVINTTEFFVEKSNYNTAQIASIQAKYQYLYKTKIVNFYLHNSVDN